MCCDSSVVNMANIITGIRIVISISLLFCLPLSPVFLALYIAAGISDMIDGTVARKTGTASEFGEKLVTAADIVFTAVCLIKIIPVLDIPLWLIIWTSVIALIKVINIVSGFAKWHEFVAAHTVMNRLTGIALFLMPLTLTFIDLKYGSVFVCALATCAAIQEGHCIMTRRSDTGNGKSVLSCVQKTEH